MKLRIHLSSMLVGVLMLALMGCGGASAPSVNQPAPTAATGNNAQPTTAASTQQSTVATKTQPTAPASSGNTAPSGGGTTAGLPDWWPKDLPLPANTELEPISGMWLAPGGDSKATLDVMQKEGQSAGYATWTHKLLAEGQYRLYFLKGGNAYSLDVLGGSGGDKTTLGLGRNGTAHVTFSGPQNGELDLPIDSANADPNKGNFNLNVEVDNPKCQDCEYLLTIQSSTVLDPAHPEYQYRGTGTYDTVNIQLNPGLAGSTAGSGSVFRKDQCRLVAKDEVSGTFECKGLTAGFLNQSKDTYDVSGSYRLRPESVVANTGPKPTQVAQAQATETPEAEATDQPTVAATDCAIITPQEASAILGGDADQRLNDAAESDQVDFSTEQVSVIESDCSYEAGTNGVKYIVYKPNQSKPNHLAKLWTDSKNAETDRQDIKGVGDDAYFSNGDLRVKKGSYYLSVQVEIPEIHQGGDAGTKKQLDMEQQFAQKAVSRLP